MTNILFALWFFLPAGLANGAPVIANHIPILKKLGMPLDGSRKFRGKRIFGSHKTLRGLLAGILVAFLTGAIQMLLYSNSLWIESVSKNVDYSNPIVLLMGAVMGFGALFGDAVESFLKRQLSIKPGKNWFPFDQLDFIIGGLLFSLPFVRLSGWEYLAIIIFWFVLHPIAGTIFWLLKLRDKPF